MLIFLEIDIFILIVLSGILLLYVGRFYFLELRQDRIPVLNYHRIIRNDDLNLLTKDSYAVSVGALNEQMQLLENKGYTTIDLDDFLYYKQHKNELPPKPVIITFDDGYENNYLYAYPILKKHGFKAIIYSVIDPRAPCFTIECIIPQRRLLPEQMKELSENGISIQGHTASHARLKTLTDSEIKSELKVCKETLQAITQRPVCHMAIPYGSYDNRLFPIAKELGYKTIVVPGRGTINLDTDAYRLHRMSVHIDTGIDEFNKILASPSFAVISRLYAISHLTIRRVCGKHFEDSLKRVFLLLRLDNPSQFIKFAVGAVMVILAFYLLMF
jgi:peptidoglycan/xylan/chitin deacetylase (PgdA/CDA1 family)